MLRTKHADQSDEELAALTAVLLTRAAANAAAAAPPARPMLRPAPHLAYRSPVSWLQAA
ncbi:acyl-CoA carboxylase subunit epsilon [Kitasatospora sp. NBC_01250]|uniref:acyl-CoA carboxylase epsilon subunit n=1 Tax=unclassified Kitasatospora TaxID=2633591 RepID=UPI002E2EB413|nr:acyl-CoA carboxylase epsilon subunit [Kitasatospora sp. NBC_01250]